MLSWGRRALARGGNGPEVITSTSPSCSRAAHPSSGSTFGVARGIRGTHSHCHSNRIRQAPHVGMRWRTLRDKRTHEPILEESMELQTTPGLNRATERPSRPARMSTTSYVRLRWLGSVRWPELEEIIELASRT